MDNYIKEIFRFKKSEYRALRLTDEEILGQARHFIITDMLLPLTPWRMFYYIDRYGDFINRGKQKHHRIARAIFNSMSARRKIEILEYISEEN